jgi:hypothetical protein
MQDLLGARYWAVAGEPWTPRQCDSETQMLRRWVSSFLKFVLNSDMTCHVMMCRSLVSNMS